MRDPFVYFFVFLLLPSFFLIGILVVKDLAENAYQWPNINIYMAIKKAVVKRNNKSDVFFSKGEREAVIYALRTRGHWGATASQVADYLVDKYPEAVKVRLRKGTNYDGGVSYVMNAHNTRTRLQHCCGVSEPSAEVAGGDPYGVIVDSVLYNRRFVLVTVNDQQKSIYNVLTKSGFRVVEDWVTNPNTGRKIAILLHKIPDFSSLSDVVKRG